MTQEQHLKAKEISDKVGNLKNHLMSVIRIKEGSLLLSKSGYSDVYLKGDFLPISKDDFMGIYISKVEKAISICETEFNNL
jgi:hypothetical protein